MNDITKQFEQALTALKNNAPTDTIFSNAAENERAQLQNLLQIGGLLRKIQTIKTPQPLKRKLFLRHQPVISRFSIFVQKYNLLPIGVALGIFVITGTTYGATLSLPGDKLFFVKRAVEVTRVSLTTNPQNKAMLQVEIAQQRLEDAQKIVNKAANAESQQLAVKALDEQTTIALNNLKGVAAKINNKEIVDKAEKIAANKNSLLEKVTPDTAKSSAEQSQTTIKDIKQIIATAEEKTAAKIDKPREIFASGVIAAIKGGNITVEKADFVFEAGSSKTADLIDNVENPLDITELKIGDTVQIYATLKNDNNVITRIIRTFKAPVLKENSSAEIKVPIEKPVEKPKDTFGGFIAEPVVQTPESN